MNWPMRQTLNPETNPALCDKLVEARAIFRSRLADSELEQYVEPFDPDQYNEHATIAENLLFGTSTDDTFATQNLAANEYLGQILSQSKLDKQLYEMGIELAETAVELFADLSPDNPFFEQLNFMTPEQIEEYPPVLTRIKNQEFDAVSDLDKRMLISLPFNYIEPRNRLGLLKTEHQSLILQARKQFKNDLPERYLEAISFYETDSYNGDASVQDNILLGRIAHGHSEASEKIIKFIRELLEELGLTEDIFKVGLMFDIGTAGKRLSETQRQKVALARALLKRADLLILNRAANAIDTRAQERIVKRIIALAKEQKSSGSFGVLWVLMTTPFARNFDRVLVFERGRLVQNGTHDDLLDIEGTYSSLVS